MKVLYLPIDERQCNSRLSSIYFRNISEIELNIIPIKYMGRMKNQGDIDSLFSYLEEALPLCDVAVLSLEMLIYGGYLPSRVHHKPIIQLKDRLDELESLLLKSKSKNSKIYLYSNIMMTTQYSSSESDCYYYSNYGEFIFKRSYLLDKKKNIGLNDEEEKELNNCIKIIPASVMRDYEQRVNSNKQLILECSKLLKNNAIEYLAINSESDIIYGYESIAKNEMQNHFKQQKVDDKVLKYSEIDEFGFVLICRAILLDGKKIIKISLIFDGDTNNSITDLKKKKLQYLIKLSGAVYAENINEGDLILFVHREKCIDIGFNNRAYSDLITLSVPFVVMDDVFENKADLLFVRSIFESWVSDDFLSYSCSRNIGKALASGLIQYQYGTKKLRDAALFDAMLFEYAFKSCVRDKYAKALKDRSVGNMIHINDIDVELKGNIRRDIEFELLKLYKTIPHTIKEISFPWYRLDEITMNWD